MVLLSAEVTGVVTWIGTLIGMVGLALTYLQARSAARSAALAASGADQAERAVIQLERNLALADAAHLGGEVDRVMQLIHLNQPIAAQAVFDNIKRRSRLILKKIDLSEKHRGGISRNLTVIGTQLNHLASGSASFKGAKLATAVSGLSAYFVEIEDLVTRNPDPRRD